ncbi:hypothetical protein HO173_009731 [Letharia columbiana]|uniref:Uncharacterized protein n=1 Tax=Letharia columbiana TaxID=112416 RepID=A0A8H6FP59_9LECA|nr:uncharacterized protein HO173_009731 [Letharia columbiana]KAF6232137.1 hypothetical protein HO173_009731 [Letharia columbiana]
MRVGIIGAGISGVVAGAHLKAAGVLVTVFERSGEAGGVWLYDERLPPEPTYPSIRPSEADFHYGDGQSVNGENHQPCPSAACGDVKHAPPGPCYEGLTNNVSTRLMKLKINSWPPGTADFVNHRVLNEYIQDTSYKTGVHLTTKYNTRVEKVFKSGQDWKMQTSTLTRDQGALHRVERDWTFDAVIIASGHYHACRIPDISGLAAWKKRWPSRVQHSKSYRHPRNFRDQNVLLIGAGVSSTDIAREIGTEAKKIYQVSRGGVFDLPTTLLPPRATRITGEIHAFECQPPENTQLSDVLEPIPGRVVLKDGRELTGIHHVVICTGYHMSLPFLQQYHSDNTPVSEANNTVLVTDGTQVHNLHKDIFYIPDPSLIFIGIPFFTANFSLFEFQAMAVAAVLTGKALLPTTEEMSREYQQRLQQKGTGRMFHSLRDRELEYVNELVNWMNRDGARVGAQPVEGHTKAWHVANVDRLARVRQIMEDKARDVNTFA